MKKQDTLWIDIKKLRVEREWLQKEAAERLGVTRAHLSAVENRKRGISKSVMAAIIRVFDVSYEDFVIDAEGTRRAL